MFSPLARERSKLTVFRTLDDEEKPVKTSLTDRPEIPRKPKKPAQPVVNGAGKQNGKHPLDEAPEPGQQGVKRSHPGDDDQPIKKAKMTDSATDDVVIVDDAGGAIVIDDD